METDAAVAVLRLERGTELGAVELVEDRVEQAEVHPADELGVFLGEFMERAVVQHGDAVGERLGLEAAGTQLGEEPLTARLRAGSVAEILLGPGRDDGAGTSAASASTWPASS